MCLQVLHDPLALVDEPHALVLEPELVQDVGPAPNDGHPVRTVGREVHLRLRDLALGRTLPPELEELRENLERFGLAPPDRGPPRRDERALSGHTPLLSACDGKPTSGMRPNGRPFRAPEPSVRQAGR